MTCKHRFPRWKVPHTRAGYKKGVVIKGELKKTAKGLIVLGTLRNDGGNGCYVAAEPQVQKQLARPRFEPKFIVPGFQAR